MRKIAFYSIFLGGLAVSVNAAIIKDDVIKIDFGATASLPAAGNWNDFDYDGTGGDTTVSNLKRFSDNAGTGVSITVTGIDGQGINMADGSAFGGSSNSSVYVDHTYAQANTNRVGEDTLSFTISGLDDTLTYDLFGGFYRAAVGDIFKNEWDVGGVTQTFTNDGATIVSFADYSGLSSAGGQITFTITDLEDDTDLATIAELTITAVPEPSNFALISASLALASVMLRRRRA